MLKLVKVYHLEGFLELSVDKIFKKCFKFLKKPASHEACGFFYIDSSSMEPDFQCLENENECNSNDFINKNPIFYKRYLKKEILCLAHNHLHRDSTPSQIDVSVSESFALPSYILSVSHNDSYLYYPNNYKPRTLENRIFIPQLQDCVNYVKDYLLFNFNINLHIYEINWARRKLNPNLFLFEVLNNYFEEIKNKDYQNGDLLVFEPTLYQYYHLGIVDHNNYIFHHPVNMFPRKELINSEILNKVYKVYRYKVL